MSLDVTLRVPDDLDIFHRGSGIFVRENGRLREIDREEWDRKYPDREPFVLKYEPSFDPVVFTSNITHNLDSMAGEAGLYEYLWRPDTMGITRASQLVAPLRKGLREMESDPARYKLFNPPNGWGDYEGLVSFVRAYLDACERYPDAMVEVSR